MADANRVRVGLVAESSLGVTPTSPVFQTQRITNAGAAPRLNSIESREIRSDRQLVSLINTWTDASGEIAAEVSFGAQDALWEAALMGTWDQQATWAIASMATNTITLTAAQGATYKKGALVMTSGMAIAGNNNYWPLAATGSGSTMTIVGGTTETAPAGAVAKVVGIQGASGDIAAVTGPTRLVMSAATGVWTDFNIDPGDWIFIGGEAAGNRFTGTPENNGPARVLSVSATTLTLDRTPAGFGADTGTGKTIRIHLPDKLVNGSTITTFTQKREFQDVDVYEYARGLGVDRLTFGGQGGGILEATWSMEGTSGALLTDPLSGETDVEPPAWTPIAMNRDVDYIGSTVNLAAPNYTTRLQATIANNIRKRIPIGFTGASSIGLGQFNVQLTLDTYFGDSTLYAAVLAGSETSFAFGGRADAGGAYMWDFPRIRAASGSPTVPGINQDVMLPITYQALRSAALTYTMKMCRFTGSI